MGVMRAFVRRWIVAIVAATLFISGMALAQSSFAVHDTGMFELDGNIAHDSATTPPYDWADLFNPDGTQKVIPDPVNGPLLASTFANDTTVPDKSYFQSNKDVQPMADWGCATINNPTPKDNLQNAYAALIKIPANAPDDAGHTVLYLGSERLSNSGSSFAGFWLFKDPTVGCSSPGSFTGHHTDGDLLVVSNYTNGGSTQNVVVYRWTGNDATGSLVQQSSGGICGSTSPDTSCAIANTVAITSPWAPTTHQPNTFVEAGLDLTALLGNGGGCFTTFMAETRSSPQLSATLKDYATGQFNTCAKPPIDTTDHPGGTLVAPGTSENDVATLSPVGNQPAPTGTVTFFLCDPSQVTSTGCDTGGTQVGTPVTIAAGSATSNNVSGATDTTVGKYCWRAEYTPDAASSGIYLPATHTNATTECFTIAHATPTVGTSIAVTGVEPGTLGLTTLGDKATLNGYIGNTDGETMTFNLFGPFAPGVAPSCTTSIFTTTGTLSGGVATTSSTFTPTSAGTYVWQASYPGDPLNSPVTEACNDTNESTTIIGPVITVTKTADPPGPVSAGDTIGFDISLTNTPAASATNVVITDHLPAGNDLDWTLAPPFTNCSISGAVGAQTLTCNLGTVAKGATVGPIHVQSATTDQDCSTISNTASFTAGNASPGSSSASVQVLCASVSLTKTADAGTVNAGDQIGFVVTAHNAGPGIARGVVINDPLPAGSGVSWTIASGPANCSITGGAPTQVLTCTAVDLASGASEVVHVISQTVFASCGTYNNTATLTVTNSTPPNPAQASTTVQCAALTLTKTADAASVNAGSQIGFVVTAGNTGPGTAYGVTINDPLPGGPGVSWTIASGPGTCSIGGTAPTQTLTCTLGNLAAGDTVTVHVVSNTVFASCGTYDNTAQLTSTNTPSPSNASASTTVLCSSLTLTKTADNTTVDAGNQIGFTIIATNGGQGTATGVVITDPLPGGSGVDWSIASGPANCSIGGTPPTQTLTCTAVDLAQGASETIHLISATAFASCAVYPNQASLTSTNSPALQAQASLTVQCPSLAITKTADAASVSAGSSIGFTVTVSNGGPGAAHAVTLDDPLPAGSGVTWSISPAYSGPGTCSITGAAPTQDLTCAFGDMAAGASATVHVTSATVFASCGTYDNTATATATNEPGNLQASATEDVLCPVPSITKTADAATVDAGSSIGFTITAANSNAAGTGTATGVVINDPLPAGTGVTWTIDVGPSNCSITGAPPTQTLVCTAVDLAPGDSETVHVTSTTVFASCATYDNTATLTLTNGPSAPLTSNATTTVQCAALALTKTADAATVNAGDPIGFTVTVANTGAGTAKGVLVHDPLPTEPDIAWTISPAYTGQGSCAITGSSSPALDCQLGDLAAGLSVSVHISSTTDGQSCGTLNNTATLTSTNAPGLTASASTQVVCGAALAATGPGPIGGELQWGVVLVVLGGLLTLLARRRQPTE